MNSRFFRLGAVPSVSSTALALALVVASGCTPQEGGGGPSTPGSGGQPGGGTASGGAIGSGGASNATGGAAVATGGVGSGGAATGGTATGGRASGGGGGGPLGGNGTGSASGGAAGAGTSGSGGQAGGGAGIPDPGTEGDGNSTVGPNYTTQADLNSKGNPKGKSFRFDLTSKIFDGKDATLTQTPVNVTRSIQVYVPAMYKDGTPAPALFIQDGPGPLTQVSNALDNLTISTDPMRKLPPFIVIALPSGGADSIGSERGLEYDTLSDRYARFLTEEVMPAVQTNLKSMYPNLKFDPSGSGRAGLGCSSGAAAAFTMAWFRPDLFSRVIAYSTTLVAQQDPKAPESKTYPHGAWDYHSDLELIKNDKTGLEKKLRIFHNANEMDNGYTAAESGRHNWLLANQKTAAALKAKGFHYQYVEAKGLGHCDDKAKWATLADALVWVWRGYQPLAQ